MPVIDIVLITVIALMGGSYAVRGWRRSRSPSSSVEGYGRAMEVLGDLSKKRSRVAAEVVQGVPSGHASAAPGSSTEEMPGEGIVTAVPTPKPLRPARSPSQPRPAFRIRGPKRLEQSTPLPVVPSAEGKPPGRKHVAGAVGLAGGSPGPDRDRPRDRTGAGSPRGAGPTEPPRHERSSARRDARAAKRATHQGGRGVPESGGAVGTRPDPGSVANGAASGRAKEPPRRRTSDPGAGTTGRRRDPVLLAGVGAVAISLVAVGAAAVVSSSSPSPGNAGHGVRPAPRAPSSTTTVHHRVAAAVSPLAPATVSPGLAVYDVHLRTYRVTVVTTGPCWVEERSGPNTTVLWQQVMPASGHRTMEITGTLWLRLGNPPLATVRLDGRPVAFPASGGVPVNLFFKGIRPPGTSSATQS